jgi:pteridine reductase
MKNFSHSEAPVALITGAARRIGAVIAQNLHQSGYRVIIHYNQSQQAALDLAKSLNQRHANSAQVLRADLNQFDSLDDLIDQSAQLWGRLDVLINNASSFFPTPVGETTEAHWQDLINTNLKAPYFLAQAASNYLKRSQGCIINIADIHGERPLKNYPVYSIAKAGLIMLTQALARELAPEIRVNAIAPGVTLLPEKSLHEELVMQLTEKNPLKHFANPEDIAQAVLFFIQQQSITGQTLNIDGGRSVRQ